jgi:hypothetical protein
MARDNYVAFWCTHEELESINKNAQKEKKTRAKYIRDRAIRPDSTNNEIANLLMGFIATKFEELKYIAIAATPQHDTEMMFKPNRKSPSTALHLEEAGLDAIQKQKLLRLSQAKKSYRQELQAELSEFLVKRKERVELAQNAQ